MMNENIFYLNGEKIKSPCELQANPDFKWGTLTIYANEANNVILRKVKCIGNVSIGMDTIFDLWEDKNPKVKKWIHLYFRIKDNYQQHEWYTKKRKVQLDRVKERIRKMI